ncbi:MAG: acyl-CoA desaturase [Pirellulaceae bacterium]|nr:acyl-CoA desaturase [Pirellulaceae bacterium]MDP7017557.1 acyl-CoA desaturase [Pirellulaceae bacterium]
MPRPQRMRSHGANAVDGTVVWSPVRSLWFSAMAATALVGGALTFSWQAAFVSALLTIGTLCFGHSVGLHRLLIHRSFTCPLWLEYCMVYAGVLVGMGGPRRVIFMHEIRDWSQNQPQCHPFYIHKSGIFRDGLWNLHCECRLQSGPEFAPEERVTHSEFYRLLDRYWMAAQLPVAGLLFLAGGWPWVVWGICVRVTVSLVGHWMVGYFAHNRGELKWTIDGASVQGRNIPWLALLTMGESWHNNHHAFPDSARLGVEDGQLDPGWWLLATLKRLRMVEQITLPADLTNRGELTERGPSAEWRTSVYEGERTTSRAVETQERRSDRSPARPLNHSL